MRILDFPPYKMGKYRYSISTRKRECQEPYTKTPALQNCLSFWVILSSYSVCHPYHSVTHYYDSTVTILSTVLSNRAILRNSTQMGSRTFTKRKYVTVPPCRISGSGESGMCLVSRKRHMKSMGQQLPWHSGNRGGFFFPLALEPQARSFGQLSRIVGRAWSSSSQRACFSPFGCLQPIPSVHGGDRGSWDQCGPWDCRSTTTYCLASP